MKFVVPVAQTGSVLAWARANLPLDQHVDRLSETYSVASLYFDTSNRDVYHGRTRYQWVKYRVRRYGVEPFVFLELKSRHGNRVAKRRVRVDISELPTLGDPSPKNEWLGSWFYEALLRKHLKPSLLVTYRRAAYGEGASRVTLDTPLFCAPAAGYSLAHEREIVFFTGSAILELKYRGSMPDLFWKLIGKLTFEPVAVSKYRLGMTAAGLARPLY
jgi:hypothetical protein